MNGQTSTTHLDQVAAQPTSCRGRWQGVRCTNPPAWDVVLTCDAGHLGGGGMCEPHRAALAAHPVAHTGGSGCSALMRIVTAVPL